MTMIFEHPRGGGDPEHPCGGEDALPPALSESAGGKILPIFLLTFF
ncbi:MAG: hypothetical protein ABI430_03155 [Candidatus Taylorbacteria bacterium]